MTEPISDRENINRAKYWTVPFLMFLLEMGISLNTTNPAFASDPPKYITFHIGVLLTAIVFSPLWRLTIGQKYNWGGFKKTGLCLASYYILSLSSQGYYEEFNQRKVASTQEAQNREFDRIEKLPPRERAQEYFTPIASKALWPCQQKGHPTLKAYWTEVGENFEVTYSFVLKDGYYSGNDYGSLIQATYDISKNLVSNKNLKNIQTVILRPQVVGLNKYGNEAFESPGLIRVPRSEIEKINWSNMDINRFDEFLKSSGLISISDK